MATPLLQSSAIPFLSLVFPDILGGCAQKRRGKNTSGSEAPVRAGMGCKGSKDAGAAASGEIKFYVRAEASLHRPVSSADDASTQ